MHGENLTSPIQNIKHFSLAFALCYTDMTNFHPAGPAEILRASQKDDEYMHVLKHLVSDVAQKSLGLQTLGEEYVNIVQVDSSLKQIPSKWRRILDVGLQTFGHYILLKFQRLVENHVNVFTAVARKYGAKSHEATLAAYLPHIFKAITILQRIHLIAFYFSGSFYTLPKRLAGIRYVVIRRWLTHPSYSKPFRILGGLAASQLCLGLIVAFFSSKLSNTVSSVIDDIQDIQRDLSETSSSNSPRNQCSLCLERRNFSTVTPCGHLFCWSCITSWLENKEECPLCREAFAPSKLVYLQNY